MKRIAFVMVATAAMGLSACNSSNQDAVENAELNQPNSELNDLANQAAMDAANAEEAAKALAANQAAENAAADNVVNPQEADEQNVSGM